MTTRKADLLAAVERLGATVDEDCGDTLFIDAPTGYQFRSTGTHALSVPYIRGDMPEIYRAAIYDLSMGIIPCDGGSNCDEYGCERA